MLIFPTLLIADPPKPPADKTWDLVFQDNFDGDELNVNARTIGQEWMDAKGVS